MTLTYRKPSRYTTTPPPQNADTNTGTINNDGTFAPPQKEDVSGTQHNDAHTPSGTEPPPPPQLHETATTIT